MANSTLEVWNNGRKVVYEELDCERNQKFYVEVCFFGRLFYPVVLTVKKLRRCFFLQFEKVFFSARFA